MTTKKKDDFLDQIIKEGFVNQKELILKGFYLEEDVVEVLEKLSPKRGMKSRIVNLVLKEKFKEKGYL